MVGRENKDIKKDERDNWNVAAVPLNEYCYRVMRKHSPNLLIDFLNDVKSAYLWISSGFIRHGCFHINKRTYVSMYSTIKYTNKASVVFRVYGAQLLSGYTRYFLLTPQSAAVDHLLTGRSRIEEHPRHNRPLKYPCTRSTNPVLHSRTHGNKTLLTPHTHTTQLLDKREKTAYIPLKSF